MLFRNNTSQDKKRRELSISEVTEKEGVVKRIVLRCTYYVNKQTRISQPVDIEKLVKKGIDGDKPNFREFHIIRTHDSRLHEDKFIWKVDGNLFVIVRGNIFSISFTHSFEVETIEKPKERR